MRHGERVSGYGWLTDDDSGISEAGCVTVVVGDDTAQVAEAFGIDLDTVIDPSALEDRAAAVRALSSSGDSASSAQASVVVEDNGYEGTRVVVLGVASKSGQAASIFWNVNGMVTFSCARKGRLLASVDLGMGQDLESLPRRLVPLAEMAEDEDVDVVAIGAAMVSTFTGHDFGPEVVTGELWHPLTPRIEPIHPITAESSPLNYDERPFLESLLSVPAAHRRSLAQLLLRVMVDRAGLTEDRIVSRVLRSMPVGEPATYTPELEAAQRRWARESEAFRDRWTDSHESGPPVTPEESRRSNAGRWVGQGLQHACSDDDLTALLGVGHAALVIFSADELKTELLGLVADAAARPPAEWSTLLDGLPAPPSEEQRQKAHRKQLKEVERDRATWHREEVWDPEGKLPPGSYEMVDATGRRVLVMAAEEDAATKWERLMDEGNFESD